MQHGLTAEQVAFFHREGYLVVEGLLDEADLQPAIDEVHGEVNSRAEQLVAEGVLSRTFAEAGFMRQLALISKETDQVARSIWNGQLHGEGFFKLITHDKLLDVAESLCGEELIASSVYRLRPKIPNYNYGAVPWHQDSGYFEPYCDSALVLTVWMPLVDATEENGCLWVIPRAHRGAVLKHHAHPEKAYLEIDENDLPVGERVCCPVPKGGVLLLTNRTPHVSFENQTDVVRWSMDLRYQSAALPTNATITRLEDESHPTGAVGDEGYVPVACYPPEADFLVRSKRRPHEVLRDAAAFAALRSSHQPATMTRRWATASA